MSFRFIILASLCLAALLAACDDDSLEDELRSRVAGFLEAVLIGDAPALDDYVSDSCAEKAEFLVAVGEEPAFEDADVEVPAGAF